MITHKTMDGKTARFRLPDLLDIQEVTVNGTPVGEIERAGAGLYLAYSVWGPSGAFQNVFDAVGYLAVNDPPEGDAWS